MLSCFYDTEGLLQKKNCYVTSDPLMTERLIYISNDKAACLYQQLADAARRRASEGSTRVYLITP